MRKVRVLYVPDQSNSNDMDLKKDQLKEHNETKNMSLHEKIIFYEKKNHERGATLCAACHDVYTNENICDYCRICG